LNRGSTSPQKSRTWINHGKRKKKEERDLDQEKMDTADRRGDERRRTKTRSFSSRAVGTFKRKLNHNYSNEEKEMGRSHLVERDLIERPPTKKARRGLGQ